MPPWVQNFGFPRFLPSPTNRFVSPTNVFSYSPQSGMHQAGNCFMAHERLAIIDPSSGDQPLFNGDKTICVSVNGEIYNYKELQKTILGRHPGKKFATDSDCEVSSCNPNPILTHS